MTLPSATDELLPLSELEPPREDTTRRGLAVSIALLLLIGGIAAVVVRGGEPTPQERFAAIPAAIADEPFAYEINVVGTTAGVPGSVDLTMTGAIDPSNMRMRGEMDLSSVLPAGMGLPAKVSFLSDGTALYTLLPGVPGAPPRWIKVELAALTQGAGGGGIPSTTNPIDSFKQLQAVGAEIEDLGEEDVRGTTTTHYRTRLDVAKVLDTIPDGQRTATAELLSTMTEDIPVEVWLDDEDRPRRQRMQFTTPTTSMMITVEAFDFGTDVTIELPPADQVVEN